MYRSKQILFTFTFNYALLFNILFKYIKTGGREEGGEGQDLMFETASNLEIQI